MASMLELPRELYLMICSYFTAREMTQLTGVCRDHYLAAQQPLYSNIRLSSYAALVKLVGTLTKVPVVSHISLKQRLRWYKLSDEQLRERDIKQLSVLLDSRKDNNRITGAVLARCIGAISRKCADVKISIVLCGVWRNFTNQLEKVDLPNVIRLTVFLEEGRIDPADTELLRTKMWELAFCGSTFPDLHEVYLNTLVDSPENMPSCMRDGLLLAEKHCLPVQRTHPRSPSTLQGDEASYYGLLSMREIKLQYNTFLTSKVLESLFGSSIIPKRLTVLEIVNCSHLDLTQDLEVLATLLKRGLQLLRFLKLHLTHKQSLTSERRDMSYTTKINEHPEHHLCNIIREHLTSSVTSLDLALPFACNRIFVPPAKKPTKMYSVPLELPTIPEDPVNTLPQRLMAAGYQYRRLLFRGICRDAHAWDEMAALACDQSNNVSWELLCKPKDKAVRCVSGCLPVEFSAQAAMQHPFDAD